MAGVERRRGLIQHQHGGIAQQGAGQRQPLPLAGREPPAALAQQRVVALRHVGDHIVDMGGAGRGGDGLVASLPFHGDVLADAAIEEECLLEDDAELRVQGVLGDGAEVVAVDGDRALAGVPQAEQHGEQGALTRSIPTNEGHRLPRHDGQADVAKRELRVARILEAHVGEAYLAGEPRQRHGTGRIEHRGGFPQDRGDAAHRPARREPVRQAEGDALQRRAQDAHRPQERGERANRECVLGDQQHANAAHQELDQGHPGVEQPSNQADKQPDPDAAGGQSVQFGPHAGQEGVSQPENFHDEVASDGVLYGGGYGRITQRVARAGPAGQAADHANQRHHEGQRHHDDTGKAPLQENEQHADGQQLHAGADNRREGPAERPLDRRAVAGDASEEIARRRALVELGTQALDLAEQGRTQIVRQRDLNDRLQAVACHVGYGGHREEGGQDCEAAHRRGANAAIDRGVDQHFQAEVEGDGEGGIDHHGQQNQETQPAIWAQVVERERHKRQRSLALIFRACRIPHTPSPQTEQTMPQPIAADAPS